MGVRARSEEGLLTVLCVHDPVHPTSEGYKRMAKSLIEDPKGAFNREKRERTGHEEVCMIMSKAKLDHEWLYEVVLGTGAWKRNRARGREDIRPTREASRGQKDSNLGISSGK